MLLNYKNTFKGVNHPIMRINSVDGETFIITAKVLSDDDKTVDLGQYVLDAPYQPASDVGRSEEYGHLPVSVFHKCAVITWAPENQIEGEENYRIWLKAEKDGAVSYPAIWDMSIGPSPGENPIVVPPPGKND